MGSGRRRYGGLHHLDSAQATQSRKHRDAAPLTPTCGASRPAGRSGPTSTKLRRTPAGLELPRTRGRSGQAAMRAELRSRHLSSPMEARVDIRPMFLVPQMPYVQVYAIELSSAGRASPPCRRISSLLQDMRAHRVRSRRLRGSSVSLLRVRLRRIHTGCCRLKACGAWSVDDLGAIKPLCANRPVDALGIVVADRPRVRRVIG